MKIYQQLLSIIILIFFLSGCGDLFTKKVAERPLTPTGLKLDCELVMDDLADILERPITSTLNCLEKSLNLFMNVSELGKGGKLSRVSLVNYLRRSKPEIKENTYAIIEAIFVLSHLMTGESKDFITKTNVKLIIDLVRLFNQHAYRHYAYTFASTAPANLAVHESHRKRIEQAATEIQKALFKVYRPEREGAIHSVNTLSLLEAFISRENSHTLEKAKGLFFIKKIILGGDINSINHLELGILFNQLPKLLVFALDVIRLKYLDLPQIDMLSFIQKNVKAMTQILFDPSKGDRRYEGLFHLDMAIEGIDRFLEDDKKISKYRALIVEIKNILTRQQKETSSIEEEEWLLGKDIERIFTHLQKITKRGINFHKIYQLPKIKALLNSPQSVELDPADYEEDFPNEKTDLIEFSRIINNYRYLKGHFDMVYYSLEQKRNPDAVTEITTLEYLIKTAFGYYGDSQSISDSKLREILKRFENELINLEIIIPRRSRTVAETIALLGALFQYQSDDNKLLDVNEATEFAISLITAIKAKKNLAKIYVEKKCEIDPFNRVEANCFKEHFYESLCRYYRPHFPRLFEYLGANPEEECTQDFNSKLNLKYLEAAAKAARPCHIYPDDRSEIYYSQADLMSILVAMMHIETTISRWDINLNNKMDSNEVLNAYAIYKPAINSMLPKLPRILNTPKIREALSKQVYLYLVKFEEVPKTNAGRDIWKFVEFLLAFKAKKVPADRKTIASILGIVSVEAQKTAIAQGEPPFDCRWMRDPENIPR